MQVRFVEIVESDANKKGDLFCRLMGDLFHALGYDQPRFNIHKSGREIDLSAVHRTEKKIAVAECKALDDTVGGSDINKFVGVLDAEKKKFKKTKGYSTHDVSGYFISLSGFKETAIEQEAELDNDRLILLKPQKVIHELVAGKIIVPVERAISCVPVQNGLVLEKYVDLFAYNRGWVWVIYYSNGQSASHFSLVHADGKPLVKELADEIIQLDGKSRKALAGLTYITPVQEDSYSATKIDDAKNRYFKYLENECGEIQFEGLPTDKDAGSVKVKLENIFVPLHLEKIRTSEEGKENLQESKVKERAGIGAILKKTNRIAILAKPGGGKSTLIKRLAIAYSYPARRGQVNDDLPETAWFPVFIRCRELGDKVNSSITEIIHNIPNRAEISFCLAEFTVLISDALQKGTALLLIDGLDEIADDKSRITFVSQLRTFLATYPKTNIIVTSREAGFRAVGGSLASYCSHYKLSNLSNAEIEDLTIRWHKAIIGDTERTVKEAKILTTLILNDNRIKVLAENPLLLTTLLFVKRWAGYLPTKKSLLYQEMIKLLLVTWNVAGHEQLDMDEAEPQLAFVAFWMTTKGQQTITLDELKDCLVAARKQMPDILCYTKISVADFIKRVESRSSLLIMSGHKKLSSGQITPIYEYLHLSFQEYLTAKAVVDKYIPKKDAKKSILSILKPHVENEAWKEIFPLVAVLSKRETKELIEYFVGESKKYAEEESKPGNRKKRMLPELLGNCIASEIQINPELLENAMEWYAKNRFAISDRSSVETILNSKFGELFRNIVRSKFFDKYDDKYAAALGGLLGEIYLRDNRAADYNETFRSIFASLKNDSKEERCISILALMEAAYEVAISRNRKTKVSVDLSLEEIYAELLSLIKMNDLHYYFSACWSLAWLGPAGLFVDTYRADLINYILEGRVNHSQYNLCRISSWALYENMRPTLNIDPFIKKHQLLRLKEKINDIYSNPQNEFDKIVAVFIGSHVGMAWDNKEAAKLFVDVAKRQRDDTVIKLYAEKMGLELLEP